MDTLLQSVSRRDIFFFVLETYGKIRGKFGEVIGKGVCEYFFKASIRKFLIQRGMIREISIGTFILKFFSQRT